MAAVLADSRWFHALVQLSAVRLLVRVDRAPFRVAARPHALRLQQRTTPRPLLMLSCQIEVDPLASQQI